MTTLSYREKCLTEKEEVCQICGVEENIVVHHKDGDRANESLDNLVPLCQSCHRKVHTNAEGYGEWHSQILPKDERVRYVRWKISPDDQALIDLVKFETGTETDREALMRVLREYHEIYSMLQDTSEQFGEEWPVRDDKTYRVSDAIESVLDRHLKNQDLADRIQTRVERAVEDELGEIESETTTDWRR